MKTDFEQIVFDPQWHSYTLNGTRLTSVTRVLKPLKPEFDADYWAERKAQERGITAAEIKAEWDKKRQHSVDLGNAVHEHIQHTLLGTSPQQDPFLGLNELLPEAEAFDTFWSQAGQQARAVEVEWVVGDSVLGIAGTADALLFSKASGLHHLWDWKTNSRWNTENRFQTLADPFGDLGDCELANYSLQISLYRLIVERNTDLELGDSYLLHLKGGRYWIYKALDLRERLESWLKGQA